MYAQRLRSGLDRLCRSCPHARTPRWLQALGCSTRWLVSNTDPMRYGMCRVYFSMRRAILIRDCWAAMPRACVMRASRPSVSVIMPSRDNPRLLREAARSVLDEPLSDLELIVVDNGSKGRSQLAPLDELAGRSARTRDLRSELLQFFGPHQPWSCHKPRRGSAASQRRRGCGSIWLARSSHRGRSRGICRMRRRAAAISVRAHSARWRDLGDVRRRRTCLPASGSGRAGSGCPPHSRARGECGDSRVSGSQAQGVRRGRRFRRGAAHHSERCRFLPARARPAATPT